MSVNYGIFKSRFKKTIVDSIYNEIISKTARYYHFLGKENAWTDFLSPFIPSQSLSIGDIPGQPTDDFRYELHVRRDILTTKLITTSDVSYVVNRINWEINTIYDMYDDAINPSNPAQSGAIRLEDSKFFVLTSDYNVYKCLDNNNTAKSTYMPTGTTSFPFTTNDGYKWKFMYTIPISLRNRFLSSEYMPVSTALKNQFYSNGALTNIIIDDGGSGYVNPSLVVTGDGYIADNPYLISGISIIDSGFGYTSIPILTFSAPTITSGTESTATAECTLSSSSIDTAALLTIGYGYTADPNPPTITVDPPITGAVAFVPNTLYNLNEKINVNGIFYNVSVAGLSGPVTPSHTSGTAVSGAMELTVVGRQALLNPIMIKTEADISPVLGVGGEIVGVIINDGGIGYTNANIQIVDSVSPHVGSVAVLTASFAIGNVDTLQSNVELQAIPGAIYSMKPVEGGSGYGAASITVLGDGIGCTATPNITGGRITSINITNPGYGYTWTDIVVNGNGSGAVIRAIMSPISGHGYNAIDELNANSIMFYSSISRDKNQGLLINNDYRKAGLLKNIREFGSTNRFNKDVGSGCVLITGTFDQTKLAYDQLLINAQAPHKKYRIVEFTSTQILLSVFNNFTVNSGEILVTPDGHLINITAVQERTIDQFSGDFLFLTVREPFAPSEDQIITIRTVLTI